MMGTVAGVRAFAEIASMSPPMTTADVSMILRRQVETVRKSTLAGFVLTFVSAALFAVSGPLAKSLYGVGWSSGAVVTVRLIGASLILAPFAALALRGRWAMVRSHWQHVVAYGLLGMAGMQAFFFVAVQHLAVSVTLLLEMTAPLMIVVWVWARSRLRPSGVTFIGMAVAVAGLLVVLNPTTTTVNAFGIAMALAAAVCAAAYFLVSADHAVDLPSIGLTGLGMAIGAGATGVLNLVDLFPFVATNLPVELASVSVSWVTVLILSAGCTVGAYVSGVLGLRYVGATIGSFVSLVEVPLAAVAAWIIVTEPITLPQLWGGVFILLGVAFVKWGEMRKSRRTDQQQELVEPVPTS